MSVSRSVKPTTRFGANSKYCTVDDRSFVSTVGEFICVVTCPAPWRFTFAFAIATKVHDASVTRGVNSIVIHCNVSESPTTIGRQTTGTTLLDCADKVSDCHEHHSKCDSPLWRATIMTKYCEKTCRLCKAPAALSSPKSTSTPNAAATTNECFDQLLGDHESKNTMRRKCLTTAPATPAGLTTKARSELQ